MAELFGGSARISWDLCWKVKRKAGRWEGIILNTGQATFPRKDDNGSYWDTVYSSASASSQARLTASAPRWADDAERLDALRWRNFSDPTMATLMNMVPDEVKLLSRSQQKRYIQVINVLVVAMRYERLPTKGADAYISALAQLQDVKFDKECALLLTASVDLVGLKVLKPLVDRPNSICAFFRPGNLEIEFTLRDGDDRSEAIKALEALVGQSHDQILKGIAGVYDRYRTTEHHASALRAGKRLKLDDDELLVR